MASTPRVALSQMALSELNDSVKVVTARVGEAVAKSALDMYLMMLMVFLEFLVNRVIRFPCLTMNFVGGRRSLEESGGN